MEKEALRQQRYGAQVQLTGQQRLPFLPKIVPHKTLASTLLLKIVNVSPFLQHRPQIALVQDQTTTSTRCDRV